MVWSDLGQGAKMVGWRKGCISRLYRARDETYFYRLKHLCMCMCMWTEKKIIQPNLDHYGLHTRGGCAPRLGIMLQIKSPKPSDVLLGCPFDYWDQPLFVFLLVLFFPSQHSFSHFIHMQNCLTSHLPVACTCRQRVRM